MQAIHELGIKPIFVQKSVLHKNAFLNRFLCNAYNAYADETCSCKVLFGRFPATASLSVRQDVPPPRGCVLPAS
jgi:hypothetical protein